MNATPPAGSDILAMAERIATINGGSTQRMKVKLIGRKKVKQMIGKMEEVCKTPPSSKLRIR